jgi:hypothetical protein
LLLGRNHAQKVQSLVVLRVLPQNLLVALLRLSQLSALMERNGVSVQGGPGRWSGSKHAKKSTGIEQARNFTDRP